MPSSTVFIITSQPDSIAAEQLHPACVTRLPGVLFRGMVIAGQAVFFSAFAASYIINPKVCMMHVDQQWHC
jgi:hypothetical protein